MTGFARTLLVFAWLVGGGLVSAACERAAEAPSAVGAGAQAAAPIPLPEKPGSLRFAVIGDSGRGTTEQYQLAQQMVIQRERFSFDFVLMLGDNIYDSWTPEDYAAKFERPYKALLDDGVTFYAARGNHDGREQWLYPGFNTGGNRYFTFTRTEGVLKPLGGNSVQFFAIDTVDLDSMQLQWLREQLEKSNAEWKITFFHHPVYTSGRYGLSSILRRRTLESIFVEGGVDVALSGHEHLYERFLPQQGVHYFTSGAAGAVRVGDLKPTNRTAAGFDADLTFMLVEISGDTMYFQAISRLGVIVDSGSLERRQGSSRRVLRTRRQSRVQRTRPTAEPWPCFTSYMRHGRFRPHGARTRPPTRLHR